MRPTCNLQPPHHAQDRHGLAGGSGKTEVVTDREPFRELGSPEVSVRLPWPCRLVLGCTLRNEATPRRGSLLSKWGDARNRYIVSFLYRGMVFFSFFFFSKQTKQVDKEYKTNRRIQ